MIHKLKFYFSIYKRFGLAAIGFLIHSKFKKNKLENIFVNGVKSPVSLSNYGPDVTTFFQIFYGREYDINLKSAPEFIIDCGANIGLSAVFFANKYPNAIIVALEPDRNNFIHLQKNAKSFSNVICLNKAVWSHNTNMEIKDLGTGNWSFQTIETKGVSENFVASITIDQIMTEFDKDMIDLLKIDIEGAEKELFQTNHEKWLPKTKVIAIELHDFYDEKIPDIFYNALKPFSYKKYYKGENLICEFL